MNRLAFFDKTSGILAYILDVADIDALQDNSETGDYIVKHIEQEVIADQVLGKLYLKNWEIKNLPRKPSEFYIWNLSKEEWEYSEKLYLDYVNSEKILLTSKRNNLLLQSDFTELPSFIQREGSDRYNEWQIYRQTLRDITKQEGYPLNIVWPSQPN